MSKSLCVKNPPWSVDSDGLAALFRPHTEVIAARVITDRETGRSRGFGFVEIPSLADVEAVIDATNGMDVTDRRGSRPIQVIEALPREDRPKRDAR